VISKVPLLEGRDRMKGSWEVGSPAHSGLEVVDMLVELRVGRRLVVELNNRTVIADHIEHNHSADITLAAVERT